MSLVIFIVSSFVTQHHGPRPLLTNGSRRATQPVHLRLIFFFLRPFPRRWARLPNQRPSCRLRGPRPHVLRAPTTPLASAYSLPFFASDLSRRCRYAARGGARSLPCVAGPRCWGVVRASCGSSEPATTLLPPGTRLIFFSCAAYFSSSPPHLALHSTPLSRAGFFTFPRPR